MPDMPIDLEHVSADLRVVLDSINEGVHIVDTTGVTVFYNRVAASLDNLDPAEVVGRHVLAVFPSLSEDTSTLLSVLRTGRPAPVRQQTFRNYKGDSITSVNSTLPIYTGAKLIGAIEISRDVTLVKDLAERVVDLQAQLLAETNGRPDQAPAYRAGTARYRFDDIIAVSDKMRNTLALAKRAAAGGSSVLVCGETGTGKELIVQSIHNSSSRASRPFIAQNCAALPETLLEGILFGTAKGAFTGAHNRPGLFEVANGGTMFLDEVDAMPLPLQAKLLRVLQEGRLRRIGESDERPIDTRVVSATSTVPMQAVERGLIRRDLFFRLGVIVVQIPPLRERKDDIAPLVDHFIRRYSQQFMVDVVGVTNEAMATFQRHTWPGNVRELQHAIEAAVQLSHGSHIGVEHLPPHIVGGNSQPARFSAGRDEQVPHPVATEGGLDLLATLQQVEENLIKRALDDCDRNVSAAARYLGIPRQTLQNRMKRLGL